MPWPSRLPDARQLSDEVLQSLRLRASAGCELGYSEIEVAELLGLSRETVSRWWTAYVDHGLEALPGDRTGRPVGSGRTLNDGQAATAADDPQRKKPRGGGDRLPVVDPQGRRRVDPQGVRDRHAGADRRRIPSSGGATLPRCRAVKCQGVGTPRRSAIGWRSPIRRSKRGPPVRMREIRWSGETGAAAGRATATGLRPRAAAGEGRGARIPTSA